MSTENKAEVVVLMCGGGGSCCPEAHFNTDGSVDIIDTDDGRDELIHLSAGQAETLRNTLNVKLAK